MVQKITPIQPISNKHKQELKKSKGELHKRKSTLFAGVLESTMNSGKAKSIHW